MTRSRSPPEKSLKFAEGTRVLATVAGQDGCEFATIRYQDERDIQKGDHLTLLNINDEQFATAVVTDTVRTRVLWAGKLIQKRGAVHYATAFQVILRRLNEFYDDEISVSTEVKIIYLEPELARPL